jgi:N-formylglutamate amidohydrolase
MSEHHELEPNLVIDSLNFELGCTNNIMKEKRLPIIYTAHHASHNFGDFSSRCALSQEERVRFSDYGTDLTVPQNGTVIVSEYSRGIVDLNRPSDKNKSIFPEQDYSHPVRNNIWKDGQAPTQEEQIQIKKNVYDAYHKRILDAIEKQEGPTLVIAWDNTAQYDIGENEQGTAQQMKPFILSNRGGEESAYPSKTLGESVSCDPELLLKVVEIFKEKATTYDLPSEVHLNLVMKGGYITQRYSSLRHKDLPTNYPVQSFQMEYSTALTHDQKTLKVNKIAITNLQKCWEQVFSDVYQWWVASLSKSKKFKK